MNNENKNNLFNTKDMEISCVNGNVDDENITLILKNNDNADISLIDKADAFSYSCGVYPENTSMETAREISDKGYTDGNLYSADAEQWFKFTATKTLEYTICTYSSLDTIGALFSNDGKLLDEVDNYKHCGKADFRIKYELVAGRTYYVRVRSSKGETGSYLLRVTDSVLAECVYINKESITLTKGEVYELPIIPYNSYTYKGYNGAKRIPGLDVSIGPPDANEQDIWWWAEQNDVLECVSGWDDDGDRYIHVIAKEVGTSKLYARDHKDDGKRDTCEVNVVQYCGGDNYRDVTQHSFVFQEDCYYVCSKCGYKIKAPARQDKNILNNEDFYKVLSCYMTIPYYSKIDKENEGNYSIRANALRIMIDDIRSKKEYSNKYEYVGSDGLYKREYTIGNENDGYNMPMNTTYNVIDNYIELFLNNGAIVGGLNIVKGLLVPKEYKALFIDFCDVNGNIIDFLCNLADKLGCYEIKHILKLYLFLSDTQDMSINDKVITIDFHIGSVIYISTIVFDSDGNLKSQKNSVETII